MFIGEFQRWKPLLAAVQNEYDALLEKYAAEARLVPGLQAAVEEAARASDLETIKVKQAAEARWKHLLHQVTEERKASIAAKEGTDVLKEELAELRKEMNKKTAQCTTVENTNVQLVRAMAR